MKKRFELPPLLVFLIRRLFTALITLLIVSAIVQAIALIVPVEARAAVYLRPDYKPKTDAQLQHKLSVIIREHGLGDPYVVQYVRWLGDLAKGEWGWSPNLNEYVLPALLTRTPSTLELTLAAMLIYLPLGLVSGAYTGWKKESLLDRGFRFTSFVGSSVPPFILGLILLTIFYAGLQWFPPGEIDPSLRQVIRSEGFRRVTGLITVDGLLNGRADISMDALRHLILPAVTLSVVHWATLGLVTRSSMNEELAKDYILRAKASGLPNALILWRHAFRNAMVPALTSSALAAASLLTEVYVIELVFNRHGISQLIAYMVLNVKASQVESALPAGFAVYSVIVVLVLMLCLDILQALVDPRIQLGEK